MDQRPWQRNLKRTYMRGALKRYQRRQQKRAASPDGRRYGYITVVVAALIAMVGIGMLESRLGPILETTARTQTQNQIIKCLEEAVSNDLQQRQINYSDFVVIQRDEQGAITALVTDMAKLNLLRTELVETMLDTVEAIHVSELDIPLGSLIDSEFLWARGPSIKVRAIRVGTVEAEFQSEFSNAGVNQTKHRVWLEWKLPVTILLPGRTVEVPVQTQLCVSETIIVGRVPETYVSIPDTAK